MENNILTAFSQMTEQEYWDKVRSIVKETNTSSKVSKEEEKLWTRDELAKYLHVTLATLYRYSERGLIKPTKIGVRVLYKDSEIKEAIASGALSKYKR